MDDGDNRRGMCTYTVYVTRMANEYSADGGSDRRCAGDNFIRVLCGNNRQHAAWMAGVGLFGAARKYYGADLSAVYSDMVFIMFCVLWNSKNLCIMRR